MPIAMPSMPESLSYALVAAVGLAVIAALGLIASGDLAAALLVLALAGAIHWLAGRNLTAIVTAKQLTACVAVLFLLCALGDLLTGHPYQAVAFLLAAAALGYAFLLLQQGTPPSELRLGGMLAVAPPGGLVHLRMLEELRNAGILTPDEFAAKRLLVAS